MPSGLSESLGASLGPLATYALAAVVVLALLLVVLFVARRALGGRTAANGAHKGPRLAIVDIAAVDQRRKLVLVRRDDVEHLVLIGGQNDVVVESSILRVPAPLRQGQPERATGFRVEPEAAAPRSMSPAQPSVAAPEPRPRPSDSLVRPPSPLRRPLPRQDVAPADPRPSGAVAGSDGTARSDPPAQPAPLLEPAIVASAASLMGAPERGRPEDAEAASRQELRNAEPTARAPSPVAAPPPSGPTPGRAAIPTERRGGEPEPKMPPFLRRREVEAPSPQPRQGVDPDRSQTLVGPASDVASRRAPNADRSAGRQDPVIDVPAKGGTGSEPEQRSEPAVQLDAFATPVVGPSEPVPESGRREPVIPASFAPQAPGAQDAPRTGPSPDKAPAVILDPNEDAERRPLSVRSFASVIQSRGQGAEPVRTSGETARGGNGGVVSPAPAANRDRAFGMAAPSARETGDPGLDEALTRELDSDIGSLEWSNEASPGAASKGQTPAQPPEERKADRRPTLEEEMERLLGDFDFGGSRR